jgi:hypothetical protein
MFLSINVYAQNKDFEYQIKPWAASWIAVPGTNPTGYGIYYFRKSFELTSVPETFPIYVSADNRYKLFVNEKLVTLGPASGDLQHWNYEAVDLAPFLHVGKNIVAAQVWNEGELRPEGHISLKTAFILQGTNEFSKILNTDATWKCAQDSSYSPIPVVMKNFYYVAGPGELVKMTAKPKNWQSVLLQDKEWEKAQILSTAFPKEIVGAYGIVASWALIKSTLPQMELTVQRLQQLRRAEGISVPSSFPSSKTPIIIPANRNIKLLLDQTFLTNAYPTIIFSGGKEASIAIKYQESLYTKYPQKGNRSEVEGKEFLGRTDSIISGGSQNQVFTTLNWRTYRYMHISITTQNSPLVLDDIYGTFTGFPFQIKAKLETDNAELTKMFEIGSRTARLCAMETYMDCPFYEQLQYIGDSRIQALVSIYNFGDAHLIRNALNQINYSQQIEGVTASRHPSVTPQYISTFSLWYIGMLHDYMMYINDVSLVKDKLSSVRQVLNFFSKYQEADGSLNNLPHWSFTDWVDTKGWHEGIAPIGENGNSSLLDLQLLWAYQVAADLEQKSGYNEIAVEYLRRADLLKNTIQAKYWDVDRKLFADRPEKDFFSQHANTLAILTGLVNPGEFKNMTDKMLLDTTLAPASIYFKYYLHQALIKAGLGNNYLKWLGKWKENMSMGLTTWAETSDLNETRSDCHAWGASPNIEFFRTILGIDSDAPGFRLVKIEPHLGDIKEIGGEMPHPTGTINVSYKIVSGLLKASIELPSGITGVFIWKSKKYELKGGTNNLSIKLQ